MQLSSFKDLTRIEQTLFGLPFLLAGAVLSFNQPDTLLSFHLLWIFPAFLLARISGMAFNQLIDRDVDAKNPRTQGRALPTGRVQKKEAQVVAWGALSLFLLVCFQINFLCLLMAPFAAGLIYLYSYLKRFTAACHFVLGIIFACSPLMASVAVSGTILMPALFLAAVAALSIMGSDIVYALQDVQFDREHHLFSLPARLGVKKSLLIARLAHFCCLISLFLLGITAAFPIFYYLVLGVVGRTFYQFHKKLGNKEVEPLFFSCNVMVALTVFGFILASVIWDVM